MGRQLGKYIYTLNERRGLFILLVNSCRSPGPGLCVCVCLREHINEQDVFDFCVCLKFPKISVLKLAEMFCVLCGQICGAGKPPWVWFQWQQPIPRTKGKRIWYNEHAFITLSMVFDV